LPPEELTDVEESVKKSSTNKYKIQFSKNKKVAPKKEEPVEEEKEKPILVDGKHSFYSCPTALFLSERGLVTLVDLIQWSEDMSAPLIDGGLLNHTKFYFQLRQAVVGEQRSIEKEEHERAKQKTDKNSNIKTGSKPARAPKRTPRRRR